MSANQQDWEHLLQSNPRNYFLEVFDDSITPSDIDAEMSYSRPFKPEAFIKELKRLGITCKI